MKIINDSKSPQKPQVLIQPGDVLDVPDHVAPYLLGFSSAFKVHEPAPEAEPAPAVEAPDPSPPAKKTAGTKKTAAKKETD